MLPPDREIAVDVIEVDSNRVNAGGLTMADLPARLQKPSTVFLLGWRFERTVVHDGHLLLSQ